MSGFEMKTDELAAMPQKSLNLVAALISEPRLWTSWLQEHPDRSELFAETFRHVVRLEQDTGWETSVLLRQLGCQTKTTDELGRMEARELQQCCDYFAWVETLVVLPVEVAQRRQVVSRAAMLFRDVRGDIEECKRAMEAGDFSGFELLKLGEIDRAWAACQLQIEGPIGERERLLQKTNPFAALHPHLSEERLDQYLDPEDERMSHLMRARIADHLVICNECEEACKARQKVLLERRALLAARAA
jgi:hypothetical protein